MASAGGNAIDKTSVIGVFVLPRHRGTISYLNFAGARMLHVVHVQNLGAYAGRLPGGTQSIIRLSLVFLYSLDIGEQYPI